MAFMFHAIMHRHLYLFVPITGKVKMTLFFFVVPNGHEAEVKIEPNTADMNVSFNLQSSVDNKDRGARVGLMY
jgi:hypothetical protein